MLFAPALRNEALSRGPLGSDSGLERFFGDTFRQLGASLPGLAEDGTTWTLTLDVPGVPKEHLAVHVEGNAVRIETTQQSPRQFKAAYQLPSDIDPDGCEARLEHGVLTLRLAKVASAAARQIPLA